MTTFPKDNGAMATESYKKLQEMLHSPIFELTHDNLSLMHRSINDGLKQSGHCCVITKISDNAGRSNHIKSLIKEIKRLKTLQRKLDQEDEILSASLIGIYPSIYRPFCIHEIDTNAERYVRENILPPNGLGLKGAIKSVTERLLKTSPSIGGLGLIIRGHSN